MNSNALQLVSTFFSKLWDGMNTYNVPGTDWPFGGFFLALFTAGIVGKILMALFKSFSTHFDKALKTGRRGGKTAEQSKGE